MMTPLSKALFWGFFKQAVLFSSVPSEWLFLLFQHQKLWKAQMEPLHSVTERYLSVEVN